MKRSQAAATRLNNPPRWAFPKSLLAAPMAHHSLALPTLAAVARLTVGRASPACCGTRLFFFDFTYSWSSFGRCEFWSVGFSCLLSLLFRLAVPHPSG